MYGAICLQILHTFNAWRGIIYIYIYIYIYRRQNSVVGIVIKLRDRQKKKGGLIVD